MEKEMNLTKTLMEKEMKLIQTQMD